MAEVTRVPLQPVSRNSLIMLFLGIVIGALLAGGVAWWIARPATVDVEETQAGTGGHPKETDVVFVKYVGKLEDGKEFDRSQETPWPVPGIMPAGTPMKLDGVVPGFREAILQMQKGGKYTVTIPAEKAYGASPPPGSPIPPNSPLDFDITVKRVVQNAAAQIGPQGAQALPPGAELPPPPPGATPERGQ